MTAFRCFEMAVELAWLALRGSCGLECVRVELQQSGKMLRDIGPVVAAGIKMELVGNTARGEQLVEILRAGFEAVVIFGAAVEVDFQTCENGGARDGDGIVLLPESRIERHAESAAENAEPGGLTRIAHLQGGELLDERGAMRAHGAKKRWMGKGQV